MKGCRGLSDQGTITKHPRLASVGTRGRPHTNLTEVPADAALGGMVPSALDGAAMICVNWGFFLWAS